jgi:hypothetical protein
VVVQSGGGADDAPLHLDVDAMAEPLLLRPPTAKLAQGGN